MLGQSNESSSAILNERDVVEQAFDRPETNLVQLSNKKLLNSHKIFGQLYQKRCLILFIKLLLCFGIPLARKFFPSVNL